LASGVLGLIRTAAYAASFGASPELDVFFAAQRVPELVFTLVAGGALGSAFIPVFNRYLGNDDAQAWRLASAVMSWSGAVAVMLGLLAAVSAPLYMPLLLSGVSPEYQQLAADLTRWMLATTVIFSISGLVMGILNAHQQFLLPALAISMYNIGLIVGAVWVAPNLPTDLGWFAYAASGDSNVYGLALGAILGAVLHLLIQVPGLVRVRARLRPTWAQVEGLGQVLRQMLPRMLGLAVTQLNFLVNLYFAGGMVTGSNTALNVAWFLMFFALGVIAQSAGTAVFPTLARLAADGDLKNFGARLTPVLGALLFLALPASVGLMVLGEPIVRVFLERSAWLPEATAGTAWALAFFAIGMTGHALLEVLSRAFYALSDTRTPVMVGVAALLSNIVLSAVFIRFIGDPTSLARGPFAGLALANSVTTLVEAAVLWALLQRRVPALESRALVGRLGRMLGAAALMGAVVWGAMALLSGAPTVIVVGACGVLGVVAYFGAGAALRLPEALLIPRLLLRRRA
jgi:putative peptidoglycan lipid II flippase